MHCRLNGPAKAIVSLALVPAVGMTVGFFIDGMEWWALAGGLACGALLGWRSGGLFGSFVGGAITGAVGGLLLLGLLFGLGGLSFWTLLVDIDTDMQMAVVATASAGAAAASVASFFVSRALESYPA